MSRQIRISEKVETIYVKEATYKCDVCGTDISDDPYDDNDDRQELIIYLNPELCVNYKHHRDLCTKHANEFWVKICRAIKVNPDEFTSGFEDYD